MATVSIDHIAMPTENAERLIAFYKIGADRPGNRLGVRIP